MCYITFALLFKYEQGLIVFNTISCNYSKCKSPFTPKSVMNKPQAEGKVNSRQRSVVKTLVNKMGLDTFVLFNIFKYCRFVSYSEFAFQF